MAYRAIGVEHAKRLVAAGWRQSKKKHRWHKGTSQRSHTKREALLLEGIVKEPVARTKEYIGLSPDTNPLRTLNDMTRRGGRMVLNGTAKKKSKRDDELRKGRRRRGRVHSQHKREYAG